MPGMTMSEMTASNSPAAQTASAFSASTALVTRWPSSSRIAASISAWVALSSTIRILAMARRLPAQRAVPLHPGLAPRQDGARRHRLAHMIALREVTADAGQGRKDLFILDALGDHRHSEIVRQIDDGLYDDEALAVEMALLDERLVDLDFRDRHAQQPNEGGVARPEIIDRDEEALEAEPRQDVHCRDVVGHGGGL